MSFIAVLLVTTSVFAAREGVMTKAGPTDTSRRYVLEYSTTTNATSITDIPVYVYADTEPRNVTVWAYCFARGSSAITASFNGGAGVYVNNSTCTLDNATSSNARSFTIGRFTRDDSVQKKGAKSLWRGRVSVEMRGQGTGFGVNKYIHFRLGVKNQSSKFSGSAMVGYGGGEINEAHKNYPAKTNPATVNLYTAMPCTVTSRTATKTLIFKDLDHRGGDNGGYPIALYFDYLNDDGDWKAVSRDSLKVRERVNNNWVDRAFASNGYLSGDSYPALFGQDVQNATLRIRLTYKQDVRYRIRIAGPKNLTGGIVPSNVLVYNFEYDNLSYSADCANPWAVQPTAASLVSKRVDGSWSGVPGSSFSNGWTGTGYSTAAVNPTFAVPGSDRVYFVTQLKETANRATRDGISFDRVRERLFRNQDGSVLTSCPSGYGWNSSARTACIWRADPRGTSITKNGTKYYTTDASSRRFGGGVMDDSYGGRRVCERYVLQPGNSEDTNVSGSWACVNVAYYNLTLATQLQVRRGSQTVQGWTTNYNTLRPGQDLSFRHNITNTVNQMTASVNSQRFIVKNGTKTYSGSANVNFAPGTTQRDGMETIRIAATDAGKSYCSGYRVARQTNKYGANTALEQPADASCAYVPYNYDLTPVLTVGAANLEAGTVTTLSNIGGSIRNAATTNSNPSTNSKATTYTLYYFTANDKGCVTSNPTNYRTQCSGVGPQTALSANNAVPAIAPNGSFSASSPTNSFRIPDNADSICFILTINRDAKVVDDGTPNPNTKTSAPSCITLGKKPKTAILGGDVIVGRGKTGTQGTDIVTSTTTYPKNSNSPNGTNTQTTGSWGEYAALASGEVRNFGSAGGFSNAGNTANTVSLNVGLYNYRNACDANALTFTNLTAGINATTGDITSSSCATQIGKYTVQSAARPIASMLSPGATAPSTVPSTNGGLYYYPADRTISGLSNVRGTVILQVNGRATISGNITLRQSALEDAYSSGDLTSIPQVIIIASGGITIRDTVTRVDAWLITTGDGEIQTCSTQARTTNACNNQLTVNGPVVTKKLHLYRTAGANISEADDRGAKPAEVFNLRADAYLWARGYAQKLQSARTTSIKELPPRL